MRHVSYSETRVNPSLDDLLYRIYNPKLCGGWIPILLDYILNMSTMILIALTLHSFSTLVFVVASVREELLQPNTNQTMIPPLALNISEPLFTSNASFAPTNISLGTDFDIQCDWQQYGFINTPSDCQAAWQSWPRDTAEYTLVPRRGTQTDPDAYALPLMTMGRKLGL